MEEYPIAHAYRDNRINRIFGGTKEVTRLFAAGRLSRRARDGRLDLFSTFSDIDTQVSGGEAPDFAGADTPAELRESVNLVERAKRAAIYAVMKGAMKFMATMREEQEFLDYAANQLITLYAMDSAVARALEAVRAHPREAPPPPLLAQTPLLPPPPQTR